MHNLNKMTVMTKNDMNIGIIDPSSIYATGMKNYFHRWMKSKEMVGEVSVINQITDFNYSQYLGLDMVVIDISLVNVSAYKLLNQIRALNPMIKVVLTLTEFQNFSFDKVYRTKVNGLIFKGCMESEFSINMDRIMKRIEYFDHKLISNQIKFNKIARQAIQRRSYEVSINLDIITPRYQKIITA